MTTSSADRKYFKRDGWIEVDGFDIPKGLDMKFEVPMKADVSINFKASVMGLSKENCNALAQHVFWKNINNPASKSVRVYAGYDGSSGGTGAYKIAEGLVWYAMVRSPPAMWMDFRCMNMFAKNCFAESEKTVSGATVEGLFMEIAQTFGYRGVMFAPAGSRNAKTRQFTIRSNPKLTINEFCSAYGFQCTVDDSTLYANATDGGAKDAYSKRNVEAVVDRDHGLLQWTVNDFKGAKARCRLNREYRMFQWVDVKSEMMPNTGGRLFVTGVRHVGHLRGAEWYTELELLRTDYN